MSLWMIGKVLGHTEPKTTARYSHVDRDPLHEVAEQIGSKIAAAMGSGSPAEVVNISAR
jgi:hypothetical protein